MHKLLLFFAICLLSVQSEAATTTPSAPPTNKIFNGATVREVRSDLTLYLLMDIPDDGNGYFYYGQRVPYLNLDKYGADRQYCSYIHHGLNKQDMFAKVVSATDEKIYTPSGSFQGVAFEFEGGARLRIAGSLDSDANRLLESCLGPMAAWRTETKAVPPEPVPFQEPENLLEQLRAFGSRAVKAVQDSEKTCRYTNFRAKTFELVLADFTTIVSVAEAAVKKNQLNFPGFARDLAADMQKASLSRAVTKVECDDVMSRDAEARWNECFVYLSRLKKFEDQPYVKFEIRRGSKDLDAADGSVEIIEDLGYEVSYSFGIYSQTTALESEHWSPVKGVYWRNRAGIYDYGRGGFDLEEKSSGRDSQPPPTCKMKQ